LRVEVVPDLLVLQTLFVCVERVTGIEPAQSYQAVHH